MKPSFREIERRVQARFNALAHHPMFPGQVAPDDFQLQEVERFFGDVEGLRVLDAGCGKGRFTQSLAARGAAVTGVDLTEGLVRQATPLPVSYALGSVTALPFAENAFDRVLCVEVLQHVPDISQALRELVRVAKPEGRILIIDKNRWALYEGLPVPWLLVKLYLEWRGKWMYPFDFPFREQWFSPWALRKELARLCQRVEVAFLSRPGRDGLASRLPFARLYVAWRAIK